MIDYLHHWRETGDLPAGWESDLTVVSFLLQEEPALIFKRVPPEYLATFLADTQVFALFVSLLQMKSELKEEVESKTISAEVLQEFIARADGIIETSKSDPTYLLSVFNAYLAQAWTTDTSSDLHDASNDQKDHPLVNEYTLPHIASAITANFDPPYRNQQLILIKKLLLSRLQHTPSFLASNDLWLQRLALIKFRDKIGTVDASILVEQGMRKCLALYLKT